MSNRKRKQVLYKGRDCALLCAVCECILARFYSGPVL